MGKHEAPESTRLSGRPGPPPLSVPAPATGALWSRRRDAYSPGRRLRTCGWSLKPPGRTASLVGSGTVDGGPVPTNEHSG